MSTKYKVRDSGILDLLVYNEGWLRTNSTGEVVSVNKRHQTVEGNPSLSISSSYSPIASIVLPALGTYEIQGTVGLVAGSNKTTSYIKLRNITDNIDVPLTERAIYMASKDKRHQLTTSAFITTTQDTTIELRARTEGSNTATTFSDTEGRTTLTYKEL